MIWRFARRPTGAFALHEDVDLTGPGVVEADAEIIAHEPRRCCGRQPHREPEGFHRTVGSGHPLHRLDINMPPDGAAIATRTPTSWQLQLFSTAVTRMGRAVVLVM